MEKNEREALFTQAVSTDVKNHKDAKKGHLDRLVFSETIELLKSHPNEFTDEWIQEEIENREERKQSSPQDHRLEWELVALNQLKRHIRQSFPNSFSN
jgi:hypothetical protein